MSNSQNTERRSRHNGLTRTATGPRRHDARKIAEPITVPALAARLLKEEAEQHKAKQEREIRDYAERLRAEILEDMALARQAVA